MSKNMQLTVTARPYYDNDLEGTYPKLTRHLRRQDSNLVEQNSSLYELAGKLDQLLYRFDGTPLREVFLSHGDKLRNLHKIIQESLPTGISPRQTNICTASRIYLMK